MRSLPRIILSTMTLASVTMISAREAQGAADPPPAKQAAEPLPEGYTCTFCHADSETFDDDTKHLLVTEEDLAGDIHWQKGLRCHDCLNDTATTENYVDHRDDPSFRAAASPADVPAFCGHCHSSIEYMRRFDPLARVDQEMEYWTSGHGRRLKATAEDESQEVDASVATCTDCHGRHGILAVDDQQSPVYPTRVAETCATCHADEKMMADRTYHDRLLGHNQYELWRGSVHGYALEEQGDLSAPTCNDCHGNHGAIPPGVDSVANACGTCHRKIAKLFAETRMKHKFQEDGLPGCAVCHGNHQPVRPPEDDEMLGMEGDRALCAKCHEDEKLDTALAAG
ncbi:MAG: cytochrome c3 family protein, partial [Planctomycetota bacterium]